MESASQSLGSPSLRGFKLPSRGPLDVVAERSVFNGVMDQGKSIGLPTRHSVKHR